MSVFLVAGDVLLVAGECELVNLVSQFGRQLHERRVVLVTEVLMLELALLAVRALAAEDALDTVRHCCGRLSCVSVREGECRRSRLIAVVKGD